MSVLDKKTIRKVAKITKFIQRNRKLDPFDFLLSITFGAVSMKLTTLAGLSDSLQKKISRIAIHKRFTLEAVNFLQQILFIVQQQHVFKDLDFTLFKHFSKILICDSSWFELPEVLQTIFPGSGGGSSKAQGKLQLVYDFLKGKIDSCEITNGITNDGKYSDSLLKLIIKKSLLIADLGYFSVGFFHKIHNLGGYFLSRFIGKVSIFHTVSKEKINLLKLLKSEKSDCLELNILLGVHNKIELPVRLIAIKAPKEVIEKRKRKLKENRRRKSQQPNKISLQLCEWTLMITNIPRDILSSELVYLLYKIRWQIEIIFKQFKSILHIHKIKTGNVNRVLCEIYGKLIVATLIFKMHSPINTKLFKERNLELSLEKFFKRIQERSFTFMFFAKKNIYKAFKFIQKEIASCILNCIKLKQKTRQTTLELLSNPLKRKFITPLS